MKPKPEDALACLSLSHRTAQPARRAVGLLHQTGGFINRPGILESSLVPTRVAPGDTAVTSSHLSLQQELTAGGNLAQLGNPLRGLYIQHASIIERGHSQDIGVFLRRDILIRRIGCHVIVDLWIVVWVAPLFPLSHGER